MIFSQRPENKQPKRGGSVSAHSVRVLSIDEGEAWPLEQLWAVAAAAAGRLLAHILIGREGERGQAVGLGFNSRSSLNNPVSPFRLCLLRYQNMSYMSCASWPVEAREGNTFPAAGASDARADKRLHPNRTWCLPSSVSRVPVLQTTEHASPAFRLPSQLGHIFTESHFASQFTAKHCLISSLGVSL